MKQHHWLLIGVLVVGALWYWYTKSKGLTLLGAAGATVAPSATATGTIF